KLGVEVTKVEDITSYPSILGGRVKTLHPKVFGGILARRDNATDNEHLKLYNIPEIDVVIVDLYPFEQTVKETSDESAIIEKIDIGGISLIRAAAKNYKDVVIVPSANEYKMLLDVLENKNGETTLEERKKFAAYSFAVSSNYDTAIFNYFNSDNSIEQFRSSKNHFNALRYGENPHQLGAFYGDLEEVFSQLHGKAISYNNLLDLDAAINLINEFDETTFAVLKHNNACGLASRPKLIDAWKGALAGDPISAFGGVLITNTKVDLETAEEINKLFFEIILAPDYDDSALTVLKKKKNRIILKKNRYDLTKKQFRSLLNGVIVQDRDLKTEEVNDMETVTNISPKENQKEDLTFANKIVKHSKSNAIVLAKNKQLLASGVGQTSRVDALKQSIEKAMSFEQNLENAVMASDAFFPFADSVEIAHKAGITAVIQPGGSIKDKDSIEYCNKENIAMVFTGNRHFKH
ncbi:MAG: bifunctional phosphoribosylaminoimidazolecarboxamide formyltransferase/IMP cyclohydrolase, partial [Bacteroidota bacterium]|nr:bifunctional phosphoribosylaminoimidazolecarboxamide formyltransferase/IMP cyclohydrolase [Bacteroidota bacterium]